MTQATRIHVEWMTDVPVAEDGSHDFDSATWQYKEFAGDEIAKARDFAREEVRRNKFGQVWIRTEHAPFPDAAEHLWEEDHNALEIIPS